MTAASRPKRRVHYVLSTHWDREWYQSFQDYRYRLVRLLDRVLAGMTGGDLRGPFQTDGQAILLEDYLEVRPERRAEVEQRAAAGQLVIGPWYVMPDEFLVSGEALIRNLLLGRRVARQFGAEPSQAGFVCDIFGHNSQLPQIFAGFGILMGFIWRGTNRLDTRNLRWRGADGTEIILYRFGHIGYCTLAVEIRRVLEQAAGLDAEDTAEALLRFIEAEAQASPVDAVLLFDGCDHIEWDPQFYRILEALQQADTGYEIVHSSLDAYAQAVLRQADQIRATLQGELREPGLYTMDTEQQWVIPGVLSSRVWIKQQNAACETLLCHWAEPFSAYARARLGLPFPQGYLDVAWRWLIQNHPHDSIGGCSIDIVHEDMKYRFSQCRQIADRLTLEATRQLALHIEGTVGEDELRVVLFNPLPYALDEPVEVTLQIPADWPTFNEFFGFEPKPAFTIENSDGQEVPYQRSGQAMRRSKTRIMGQKIPQLYQTNDVCISLPVKLPALGYATFTVRKGEAGHPTRYPAAPGLATSERSMENAHLAVTIEANGTLTLYDKRSGQTYARLLTFEDSADIGDGWYHGQAVNEQTFVSSGASAEIALLVNTPLVTTFRVQVRMRCPEEFNFERMTRAETLRELLIVNDITLRQGADRVEVETRIDNQISDHRLRVLFPSGAQSSAYLADSAFDVVERPIALRENNHLYRELELETKPQASWTGLCDSARGLAIISAGLKESAVRDLPDRPIALTLFRSTRRTVNTDGEPQGLLHGPLSFRCWIVPLTVIDETRMGRLAQQQAAGLRAVQLRPPDLLERRGAATLPRTDSFLELSGDVLVSSTRQVEEGLEVRLYNPTRKITQGVLRCPPSYQRAQPVDFEGRPTGEALPVTQGRCVFSVNPKQIVTLLLN